MRGNQNYYFLLTLFFSFTPSPLLSPTRSSRPFFSSYLFSSSACASYCCPLLIASGIFVNVTHRCNIRNPLPPKRCPLSSRNVPPACTPHTHAGRVGAVIVYRNQTYYGWPGLSRAHGNLGSSAQQHPSSALRSPPLLLLASFQSMRW